jgi:glycosyltransferase involved in cell wall biosynthesis
VAVSLLSSDNIVKVSVIIPTKNSGETIRQCLTTLFDQTFRDFEVIIIDGNSTDKTIEIVKSFPIKKMLTENFGAHQGARSLARNMGVSIADGIFLAFADADCYFKKDWLQTIWNQFEENKSLAILGGNDAVPPEDSLLAHSTAFMENVQKQNMRIGLDACFIIKNCNMACRKETYNALGGLSPNALYGEECDFCLRVFSANMLVKFDPTLIVFHHRRQKLTRFIKHSWEGVKLYRSCSAATFEKYEMKNPTTRNEVLLSIALIFGLVTIIIAFFTGVFLEVILAYISLFVLFNLGYMFVALRRLGFEKGVYLLPLVLNITVAVRILGFLVSPFLRRRKKIWQRKLTQS